MIAKRVLRKKGTGKFKALAAYVLDEKSGGRGDPVNWNLGQYILDADHAGEKVAWAHATNCATEDVGWAVKEILATQAANKTAKADKSYHLVVSFPAGERPTREQLEDIEQALCDAIGMGDHQRVAAVHQNTDNWHMHIAINRIHPKTLRAIEPYYDQYRLQEACVALEIKHGLEHDNHGPSPERPLGPAGATEMEAHAKRISFARWIKERAGKAIVEAAMTATSWEDMHRALAEYGLVIKPRGAGLIICHYQNDRIRIKASDVHRSLSLKALTDQLGPYQPAGLVISPQAPTVEYVGEPLGHDPAVTGLWQRYQAERGLNLDGRAAAMAALRTGHATYTDELRAWHRQRWATARAQGLNRGDRISTYRHLKSQIHEDHARRRARERVERNQVKANNQVITWAGFLIREASRGDAAARSVLHQFVAKQTASLVVSGTEQEHGPSVKTKGAGIDRT